MVQVQHCLRVSHLPLASRFPQGNTHFSDILSLVLTLLWQMKHGIPQAGKAAGMQRDALVE